MNVRAFDSVNRPIPTRSLRAVSNCNVVNDAIDSFYAVDDVVRDFSEKIVGQVYPVGGHAVRRG